MRSNVTNYDLIAPTSLDAVLKILADSPDHYTPIDGGTELMVALGAGNLQPRKLISLWNLEELRFIEDATDAIIIGAGATFTDIRNHPAIEEHLPLLTQAASWTASIANHNRATIAANIVNTSPAHEPTPPPPPPPTTKSAPPHPPHQPTQTPRRPPHHTQTPPRRCRQPPRRIPPLLVSLSCPTTPHCFRPL